MKRFNTLTVLFVCLFVFFFLVFYSFCDFSLVCKYEIKNCIKKGKNKNKSTIFRDLKIEVFRHFPRTASVKKSRDQGLAVRFAV